MSTEVEFLSDTKMMEWMRDIRRTLHQYPELAFQEKQTSLYIQEQLDHLGIPYTSGIAGTGIIAELGNSEGNPCVALRADMDAIPLDEESCLSFSSKHEGIMHACGHDGHVAMLLGAAAILKNQELPGKVKLLFQPAEESGAGASEMVMAGALEGVQMIFAGHIDIHYQVGRITADPGIICSYTDPFTISIQGRGGHAAWPHEAVDSVVVASNLIMSMQTLVSREINPVFPAVVTVGRVEAGTVHNVIAEHAVIDGTVRSTTPETRKRLLDGLKRIVQGVASMSGASIKLEFLFGLPALINEENATEIARNAVIDVVGEQGVVSQGRPSLGGEDFAFYLNHVPGCLVRFGARLDDERYGLAHSSRFNFNEEVFLPGAKWLAKVALLGLQNLSQK